MQCALYYQPALLVVYRPLFFFLQLVRGVVTFSGLTINKASRYYQLGFKVYDQVPGVFLWEFSGLEGRSSYFDVLLGPPSLLHVSRPPNWIFAGNFSSKHDVVMMLNRYL
jgi:hypothetical protein